MKLESEFQKRLIREIKERLPGCIVLKNDPDYKQGIPDLSIFYKKHWAMLECKKRKGAKHEPNQDYYVDKANKMSYAAFIYPENKEDVLNGMEQAFRIKRK